MRPVNLIPSEERRGQHAPSRSGRLTPYVVVGAMLLALAGVCAVVLTGNQISERKAKIAELNQEKAQLEARAQALAGYTSFRSLRDSRTTTVASLADSRFDWERVLHELSLVLPGNVWLSTVTGTVNPTIAIGSGATITSRAGVAGPALELVGCASSQDAVAGFVSALHDIDGVTRVSVSKSELPDLTQADTASAQGAVTSDDCRTRDFIARFEILVAFDAAPVSGAGVVAPSATSTTSLSPTDASSGVTEAANDENAARNSIQSASDRTRWAVTTFIPGQ